MTICQVMNVARTGFYSWLHNAANFFQAQAGRPYKQYPEKRRHVDKSGILQQAYPLIFINEPI